MEQTSRELLTIAVERGYITEKTLRSVAHDARTRRCSPERILLERRILSVRRMERLRNHLRFRTMRRNDKAYARLAVHSGLLSPEDAIDSLRHQKRLFHKRRECIRLGNHLIERGALSVEDDRELRARMQGQDAPSDVLKRSDPPSSAATIALHEESQIKSSTGKASYRAIEEALQRVEAIRAIQEDLSTSDKTALTPDSAAEFENACRALARQRIGMPEPRPRPKKRKKASKKTTSAFIAALLNRGAA